MEPSHSNRTTNVIEALHGGDGRWCIDTPMDEFLGDAEVIDIRGWIAMPDRFRDIRGPFTQDGHELRRLPRPDVEAELPDMKVVGFDEVVDFATLLDCKGTLRLAVDGDEEAMPLPTIDDLDAKARRFLDRKSNLSERLLPLLACPSCRRALTASGSALRCSEHGVVGARSDQNYQVLPPGELAAELSPPFSANPYDTEPHSMIENLKEGLILDDGCGLRTQAFGNVANLDISPFPLTDVVGSCASLPFRDNAFDGAISVAVLEHVADPRRCVEEIARVVRPGGSVYAAVPFLQPYHGYPHHYFNMTRDGLRTLFDPYFQIDEILTPFGGLPMRTLCWFLDRYLAGLSSSARDAFRQLTVEDLAGDPSEHLLAKYTTELDPDVVMELSCVNVLLGTRR